MLTAQLMAGASAGGAELFFERLCIGLHQAGDAVVPMIRRNPARTDRLTHAGLAVRQLRFGGPLDLSTRIGLPRMLRELRPAVVMAWMGRAAALAPRGAWTLVGRLGGYYDLRRFKRCDHLVGNTAEIAAWIRAAGVPAAQVHHVANFVPDLAGVQSIERTALGVPEGAPLLLGLGRLHPAKGFDLLIQALADLPGAHAVIAGEGPERAALTRFAAELRLSSRVHLIGWRADTAALLAACDVLVCPSRHEPLGNVVLEAWSAARPVIAAAAQGPRVLIRPDTDGLLVPIAQPATLAAAIATVLNHPADAARLATAGRARWQAAFAPAVVLDAWREFFRTVAR